MAGTSDLDRQIEALRRCEYIKEAEVKALCAKAREILVEESNVQRVDAPVTVRRCAPTARAGGANPRVHCASLPSVASHLAAVLPACDSAGGGHGRGYLLIFFNGHYYCYCYCYC